MKSTRRIVVIGAGVGGLAASIDLARSGCEVTLIEKAPYVGGKLRSLEPQGRAIDAGPTVFTMRHVFESLFADAGRRLEDELRLHPASLLARHVWGSDPAILDLHADPQRSMDAIGAFAGASEARGFGEFLDRAGALHECLREPFMMSPRPTTSGLMREIGFAGMLTMWRTPPWLTLWRALAEHFRDPRLRQLFARYATYVGSSPLQAPATLMLIAHVEQSGVWLVEGGMRRVAEALASLAMHCGASLRLGNGARRIDIQDGRIRVLILVNAPADGDHDGITDDALAGLEQRVFSRLETSGLIVSRKPEHLVATRPQDFAQLFPATGGSLYGSANHGAFASFARPNARTPIQGLYLAGGSVHPGPGVPMATLSGRLAAACLLRDTD